MTKLTKTCATCKEEKLRTNFPSDGWHTRKDGTRLKVVKSDCKLCHNKKTIERVASRFVEIGVAFKCIRCGYDRCKANIDFHHKDPNEKDFTIAQRSSISVEKLKAEINKCIILCKICHGEFHAGMWQLSELGV